MPRARSKLIILRLLLITFSLLVLFFTTAAIYSCFGPERLAWRQSSTGNTNNDLVLISNRGGLGIYFTHAVFPSPNPQEGFFIRDSNPAGVVSGYPKDQHGGQLFLGSYIGRYESGPLYFQEGGGPIILVYANRIEYVVILPFPIILLPLLLLLPFLWGACRKQNRIAKGLCLTCAYDLRAHQPGEKCPECGMIKNPTPTPAT